MTCRLYGQKTKEQLDAWLDYVRSQGTELGEVEVRVGPRPTIEQVLREKLLRKAIQ